VKLILVMLLTCYGLLAHAGLELRRFDTPEQEMRYKTLINELRCLVCQNQNLADSNAELAGDLRQQTYSMIAQGKTDKEIVDYMVARYGDFVLYRPPFKSTTFLLWVGPLILLLVGLIVTIVYVRRRNREIGPDMSGTELQRAKQLLNNGSREP
jgi:cytochrome c-type biogenesis protein CcmH